jgi:hypothetical protein
MEMAKDDTVEGRTDTFEQLTKKKPKPNATPGAPGISMTKTLETQSRKQSIGKLLGR